MPAQLSRDEAAAIEDELELDNDGFMSVGQELEKDSGLFLPGEQEFAPMTEKPAREVFQEQLILSAATNDINRLKAALHVCAKDELSLDSTDEYGTTALLHAAASGHETAAGLLLDNGASVTLTDRNGNTALHHACAAGRLKLVVRLLKQFNVDANAIAQGGLTPLMACASLVDAGQELVAPSPTLVTQLLKFKANPNAADDDGGTSLMRAAAIDNLQTCELLLAHGAQADSQDKDGVSALHAASRAGHLTVVKLLLRRGAKTTLEDGGGAVPYEIATAMERTECARLLKEAMEDAGEAQRLRELEAKLRAHVEEMQKAKARERAEKSAARVATEKAKDNSAQARAAAAVAGLGTAGLGWEKKVLSSGAGAKDGKSLDERNPWMAPKHPAGTPARTKTSLDELRANHGLTMKEAWEQAAAKAELAASAEPEDRERMMMEAWKATEAVQERLNPAMAATRGFGEKHGVFGSFGEDGLTREDTREDAKPDARPDAAKLEDVKPVDMSGDGGVMKKVLQAGSPPSRYPTAGAIAQCKYTIIGLQPPTDCAQDDPKIRAELAFLTAMTGTTLGAKVITRSDPWGAEVTIGQRPSRLQPKALELALKGMCKGERAELTCRPRYMWGPEGDGDLEVHPHTACKVLIELVGWQWRGSAGKEKALALLRNAQSLKTKGAEVFHEGRFESARSCYDQSANLLVEMMETSNDGSGA